MNSTTHDDGGGSSLKFKPKKELLSGLQFFCLRIKLFSGLVTSNWKVKLKMVPQNYFSLMAVTKQRYLIFHGTRMSHGSFQVWLKTTASKSGRWLRASTVRTMIMATVEMFNLFVCHMYSELEE